MTMKRLVFVVEGNTEIALIQKVIVPYLVKRGFQNSMHAQTITTNRKQFKKGGVSSFGLFQNEIRNTLAQGNVIVTMIIDFFKLPSDFPNYTTDSLKIDQIERGIHDSFGQNENLIPYIQRHELEALMFSSIAGFELLIEDIKKIDAIKKIIQDFPNPEDINNSPQTAPSKRLQQIFKYDKVADGEIIFELIGIETLMEKCPRFSKWISRIETKLKAG